MQRWRAVLFPLLFGTFHHILALVASHNKTANLSGTRLLYEAGKVLPSGDSEARNDIRYRPKLFGRADGPSDEAAEREPSGPTAESWNSAIERGRGLVVKEGKRTPGGKYLGKENPLAEILKSYSVDMGQVDTAQEGTSRLMSNGVVLFQCPEIVQIFAKSEMLSSRPLLSQDPSYYELRASLANSAGFPSSFHASLMDRHLVVTWNGITTEDPAKVMFTIWVVATSLLDDPTAEEPDLVKLLAAFPLSHITFIVPRSSKSRATTEVLSTALSRSGLSQIGIFEIARPVEPSNDDLPSTIWQALIGTLEISSVHQLLFDWPLEFRNGQLQSIRFQLRAPEAALDNVAAVIMVSFGPMSIGENEGPSESTTGDTTNQGVDVHGSDTATSIELELLHQDSGLDIFIGVEAFEGGTIAISHDNSPSLNLNMGQSRKRKRITKLQTYKRAMFSWSPKFGDGNVELSKMVVSTSGSEQCIVIEEIGRREALTKDILADLVFQAWQGQQGQRLLKDIVFMDVSAKTAALIKEAYARTQSDPSTALVIWADPKYWMAYFVESDSEQWDLKEVHRELYDKFVGSLEVGGVTNILSRYATLMLLNLPSVRSIEIGPKSKLKKANQGASDPESTEDDYALLVRLAEPDSEFQTDFMHTQWIFNSAPPSPLAGEDILYRGGMGPDYDPQEYTAARELDIINQARKKGYDAKLELSRVIKENIVRHGDVTDPKVILGAKGLSNRFILWRREMSFRVLAQDVQPPEEAVSLVGSYNSEMSSNGQVGIPVDMPTRARRRLDNYKHTAIQVTSAKNAQSEIIGYCAKSVRRLIIPRFPDIDFGHDSEFEDEISPLTHCSRAMYLLADSMLSSGLQFPVEIQSLLILDSSSQTKQILNTLFRIEGLDLDETLFLTLSGDPLKADPQNDRILYTVLGCPDLLAIQMLSTNFRGDRGIASQVMHGIFIRRVSGGESWRLEILVVFRSVPTRTLFRSGTKKSDSGNPIRQIEGSDQALPLGNLIVWQLNTLIWTIISAGAGTSGDQSATDFLGAVDNPHLRVTGQQIDFYVRAPQKDIGLYLMSSVDWNRQVDNPLFRGGNLKQFPKLYIDVAPGVTAAKRSSYVVQFNYADRWLCLLGFKSVDNSPAISEEQRVEDLVHIYARSWSLAQGTENPAPPRMLLISNVGSAAAEKVNKALGLKGKFCFSGGRFAFIKPDLSPYQTDFATDTTDEGWANLLGIAEIAAFVKFGWQRLDERQSTWFSPTTVVILCPTKGVPGHEDKFRIGVWVSHYSSTDGKVSQHNIDVD
ncbi:hypothetical protein TWF281_011069 [Arthrobotrys megalospora]